MNLSNRGGRKSGRSGVKRHTGASKFGGAVGICLCLQCGHRKTHEQSLPFTRTKCPICGSVMIRE